MSLFASGDSETAAELAACTPQALRLARIDDALPYSVLQLEQVRRRVREFDILHFHTDYLHFPLVRAVNCPAVTTMHGRLDLPDYQTTFAAFPDMPLVSISDHQRRPLRAHWAARSIMVSSDLYTYSPSSAGYLAFLGRISPEKRPDRAIEIARRTGLDLKIAAKVDKVDEAYFEAVIQPLLANPHIEFIGEVDERGKQQLLAGAAALLFPIDWPEPFGLVLIEAMACGTPVIAWCHGSVPEVVDDGITGYIVDSVDEAVAAVDRIGSLSRCAVRQCFESRFTAARMAADYVRVYQAQLDLDFSLRKDDLPARRSVVCDPFGFTSSPQSRTLPDMKESRAAGD